MWKGKLALLVAAIIWGTAFIFQTASLKTIGVFSFSGIRFLLAAFVLLPFCLRNRKALKKASNIFYGAVLGIVLGIAVILQHFTLIAGNIGKTSFITALYILAVPLLNFLFYRHKINRNQAFSLLIATVGLYVMYNGELIFEWNDLLLLLTALLYGLQIIYAERYGRKADMFSLCFYQYLFSGLTGALPALLFEQTTLHDIALSAVPLLYTGLMSVGVAYSLQIYGQATVDTTTATLLMSLEAPIATLAAFLVLHQRPQVHELLGCALLFAAMILCQWHKQKERKNGIVTG